jgi:hypothetical protein
MSVVGCYLCNIIKHELEMAHEQKNPFWIQAAESNYQMHMKFQHGISTWKR